MVSKVLHTKDECTILDIGGAAQYWGLMDPELLQKCTITIFNLDKPVGGEPQNNIPKIGTFIFQNGDGRDLSEVYNNQYDISHSNSVVEHVGKLSDMKNFANELMRVGKTYYLQTPNLWFPIEPHYGVPFIHWLPVSIRSKLLTQWNIGFHKKFTSLSEAYHYAENINLIDKKALKCIFPDGNISQEKLFFMTKSLIVTGKKQGH